MRKNKKVLDSSLEELINKFSQEDVITEMEKRYQNAPARLIPTSLIDDTSYLKRAKLPKTTIETFASTLKEKGFYNPLVIRKKEDRYEVILGRKRFMGAKKAGLLSLPCVVMEIGDEEMLLMLLADIRDQRESSVIEMALVCKTLQEEFGYTQAMLASLSHQSRCQITNMLRLLKLPDQVIDEICLGKLSYGHARAIASLNQSAVLEAVETIHKYDLSVRETEEYVKTLNESFKGDEHEFLKEKTNASKVEVKNRSVTFVFASSKEKEDFLAKFEQDS